MTGHAAMDSKILLKNKSGAVFEMRVTTVLQSSKNVDYFISNS